MLVVDLAVNVFLTSAFIIPLRKSSFERARTLARNSVFAAVAALVTSTVNIVILSIQHGEQLSWVCLGSCGLDVFTNASIIFLITSIKTESEHIDTQAASLAGNGYGFSRRKSSVVPPAMGSRGVQFSRGRHSDVGITVVEEVCYEEDRADDEPPLTRGYRHSSQRPVVVQLDSVSPTKSGGTGSDDEEEHIGSKEGLPENLV